MPITMQIPRPSLSVTPSSAYSSSLALPISTEITKATQPFAVLDDDFKKNVRENDTFSVECLFTLICSEGSVAKEAETFLFDLYTGRQPADMSLQQQLEWDCLRFYEIIANRNATRTKEEAWILPEKILIIAGFAAKPASQLCTDIAEKINQKIPELAAYIEVNDPISDPLNASFFDPNRLISHTEVNLATWRLNAITTQCHFLDALGISPQHITTQTFSSNLMAQLMDFNQPNSQGNFIPLLFRDHWVLFGVSVSDRGQKNSVLFDSANYLHDDEKEYLRELSDKIGAENIHFIEQNIQTHLPNGCGLLVAKAQECLAENFYGRPPEIMFDFSNDLLLAPIEEQALFHRRGRAEMYGNVIDLIREMYYPS